MNETESFIVSFTIERLEALLKASPNRSDFDELNELIVELESLLAQRLQDNTCNKDVCPLIEDIK